VKHSAVLFGARRHYRGIHVADHGVAAHRIARAAARSGGPIWKGTVVDERPRRFGDRRSQRLTREGAPSKINQEARHASGSGLLELEEASRGSKGDPASEHPQSEQVDQEEDLGFKPSFTLGRENAGWVAELASAA
jgi:hypothetical protein